MNKLEYSTLVRKHGCWPVRTTVSQTKIIFLGWQELYYSSSGIKTSCTVWICRCSLDSMRLVDLLLVLLFEGRKALSRGSGGGGSSGQLLPRLRRMDSAGEKTHRQLIDCIRSKDTDALIEAIDTGESNIQPTLIIQHSMVCKIW